MPRKSIINHPIPFNEFDEVGEVDLTDLYVKFKVARVVNLKLVFTD